MATTRHYSTIIGEVARITNIYIYIWNRESVDMGAEDQEEELVSVVYLSNS